MYRDVKESMCIALQSGFGTLMFDGWEDINSTSVINVLLRTEGSVRRKGRFTSSGASSRDLRQVEPLNMFASWSLWLLSSAE